MVINELLAFTTVRSNERELLVKQMFARDTRVIVPADACFKRGIFRENIKLQDLSKILIFFARNARRNCRIGYLRERISFFGERCRGIVTKGLKGDYIPVTSR